jgi:hypothetical protein
LLALKESDFGLEVSICIFNIMNHQGYFLKNILLINSYIHVVIILFCFFKGDVCSGVAFTPSTMKHSMKDNTVIGALIGVAILPNSLGIVPYPLSQFSCIRIGGFTAIKSVNFGLYYQGEQSLVLDSNTLIENQVGAIGIIITPNILTHVPANKTYTVTNSIVVGRTSSYDCDNDVEPNDINYQHAVNLKGFGAGANKDGKVGLVWSALISASNGAPFKPYAGSMSYNQLSGVGHFRNITFGHFGKSKCDNKTRDYAITTNPKMMDAQQPVFARDIKFVNVENSSKIWIHEPDHSLINPARCMDMDCDGLKKALITDVDGTLFGQAGSSAFSISEDQWGSQALGLGDFRIPVTALADDQGRARFPNQT